MDPEENGERFRAKIVKKIIEREKEVQNGLHDIGKTKILVSIEGSDKPDEIVDYNVVLDYVNAQMDDDLDPTEVFRKFKETVGHQGPLQSNHADYRGSTYNVMVGWEDGTYTYEPLKIIAADDPVTCALYTKKKPSKYSRMEKVQRHCQARQEDDSYVEPKQTQIIPHRSNLQEWIPCSTQP